jgi:hypothetical protein
VGTFQRVRHSAARWLLCPIAVRSIPGSRQSSELSIANGLSEPCCCYSNFRARQPLALSVAVATVRVTRQASLIGGTSCLSSYIQI